MDIIDQLQIFFEQFQTFLTQFNHQYPLLVPLIGIGISFVQVYLFFIPTMIIVAMNTVVFGPLIGFLVSLIGIVLGTYSFFILFRYSVGKYLWKLINRFKMSESIREIMEKVEARGFTYVTMLYGPLILIVSPVPVTIAAGLSNIDHKTYFLGLVCGEAIMILMATFLGTGIMKMFDNPFILVGALVVIFGTTFIVKKIQSYWDQKQN
ncbi:MAG: TVP38/TMEM64 family protein [Culicoidibacterales bacterium]